MLRQHHRLDIHTARLHPVLRQFLLHVVEGALLYHLAAGDEFDRRHALQFVAEVVAHGRLQHLVHQVGDAAHHRDHIGRLGIRNVDLYL